jgi:tRNA-2-methylthio-N6-dimethylallyladenosine synthase
MEAILKECIQLAASGYKEITLLGQNIDAYGRDMVPKRTFADLLHYLNDNLPPNTISRIRECVPTVPILMQTKMHCH